MKQLNEMTLLELAAALGEAMYDESKSAIPFGAELQRRQAMLDAAEGMALAIGERFFEQAKAAYQAAKGER